ncbi:protein of unknown function [Clostridium collagenovorans DSM 3089]|uniref:Transcobalamin-like C-terminal domain-containing protein n=1 Tax=Clostridium collagenovorans DSM 3089 TaxID=1121306 RepID=A0A1M5X5M0_9CLOT|nr:DUF4430 domain-containing protein [Clostridium collagenovorans]SHH95109.1 protein of unknown function [Clostridium collagenovorans DSM 3089]
MKENKNSIILALVLVVIVALGFGGYKYFTGTQKVEGNKNITVTVINDAKSYNKVHKHNTDKETLGDALVEMNIVGTESSDYGRFLVKVDDITADQAQEEWWQIQVNGQDAQTGMDSVAIKDGDEIKLILNKGFN